MTSLLFKLFAFPAGVLLASWIFGNVDYGSFFQPIFVGLVVAGVGVAMEYVILRKGTLWISTFADVIVNWVLIYMISQLLEGAAVTIWGALLTSLLAGAIDHFIHAYLIKRGLTKKHA